MQQSIVKFYCFVVQTLLNMFRALLCPSSGARQTAVTASSFRMNVEVEVFSAVVTNKPTASGFRMNVEVEVFSAVVGLLVNKPTTAENTSTSTFIRKPEATTAV